MSTMSYVTMSTVEDTPHLGNSLHVGMYEECTTMKLMTGKLHTNVHQFTSPPSLASKVWLSIRNRKKPNMFYRRLASEVCIDVWGFLSLWKLKLLIMCANAASFEERDLPIHLSPFPTFAALDNCAERCLKEEYISLPFFKPYEHVITIARHL